MITAFNCPLMTLPCSPVVASFSSMSKEWPSKNADGKDATTMMMMMMPSTFSPPSFAEMT